jgi:TolB-like protein/DNA-binding SARP family transcriptional activator
MVRLQLLGGAHLVGADGVLTGQACQRHRLALLALLRAAPGCAVPRERATTLLWPEHPDHRARKLLNLTVHVLRRALGDDAIVTAGDELQLRCDQILSDVDEFERARSAGDYARAAELYAGPFMDGFFLPEAHDFDDWQALERARLAREYGAVLEALARDAERRGDLAAALTWWDRCASLDPLDSRAALHLMDALEASGAREHALRHAAAHTVLLRTELDADPPPEMVALVERMRHAPRPVEPFIQLPRIVPAAGLPSLRRVYRAVLIASGLAAAMIGFQLVRPGAISSPREQWIAVLPFADLSPGRDQRFLSDGIAEELLNALAQFPDLNVVARTSAFRFQTPADIREVGDQLGVGMVVEGSVRRDADRVRITAQLIDAVTGAHRWSAVYDRHLTDLFAVQEEVALAIATELKLELGGTTREVLRRRPTDRGDAYQLYLRGRYEWNKRNEPGMWNAIAAFRQAIATDPTYAAAYAGLADAYRLLPAYANVAGPEALRESHAAAQRAVALDSLSAEAHTALGASIEETTHDRRAVAREYRRAIAIDPRYTTALRWYGQHLAGDGLFDSALVYVERAHRLDPLSHVTSGSIATVHYFARRPAAALRALDDALTLRPDWATGYAVKGRVHLAAGQPASAIEALERATRLSNGEADDRALLATAYAAAGRRAEARAIVATLAARSGVTYVPAIDLAGAYLALGQPDTALHWLQRGFELSDTDLKYLKVDPRFDAVRADPEFQSLLVRLQLQ